MTIISPAQCSVTRPGTSLRVGPTAASEHRHGVHMDQQLDLFTQAAEQRHADGRPWVYERVLALVAEGRVWTDNQRRRWTWTGGETTGERMPTRDQDVLAVLQQSGYVRVQAAKSDMDVNDGRTLRVRRYELTETGTEQHTRWAALSPYAS